MEEFVGQYRRREKCFRAAMPGALIVIRSPKPGRDGCQARGEENSLAAITYYIIEGLRKKLVLLVLVPHLSSYFWIFDSDHQCSSKWSRNASPLFLSAASDMQTHQTLTSVSSRDYPCQHWKHIAASVELPVAPFKSPLATSHILMSSWFTQNKNKGKKSWIYSCKQNDLTPTAKVLN